MFALHHSKKLSVLIALAVMGLIYAGSASASTSTFSGAPPAPTSVDVLLTAPELVVPIHSITYAQATLNDRTADVGAETTISDCLSGTWRQKGTFLWWVFTSHFSLTTQHNWCWNRYTQNLTWRHTQMWTNVDGYCYTGQPPSQQKLAGGVGYSYVNVQTQAEFGCDTGLPFGSFHGTVWGRYHLQAFAGWAYAGGGV